VTFNRNSAIRLNLSGILMPIIIEGFRNDNNNRNNNNNNSDHPTY